MSTNSNTEREGGASASSPGLAHLLVPRLSVAPGGYAAWRPVMENVLMRAGIAARDYKKENKDWAALVEAVDQWAIEDESASIAHALGRASTKGPSSSTTSSTAGPSAAEKETRRGAIEVVARTAKAHSMLFGALSEELRRLVAHVPQGNAFGLWSWLEKRFQSTEQDNIGDLWDEFTGLSQGDNEPFDEYKARVDRVYGLLAHAKDKPSAGLYAHRLLWKLTSRFDQAVLALKASGKLKEADKIDWPDVVVFINAHERSELRLAAEDRDGAAMSATSTFRNRRGGLECYNCGEKGHIARDCKKPRKARRDEGEDRDRDRDRVIDRDRDREGDRDGDRDDREGDRDGRDRDRDDRKGDHDRNTRDRHIDKGRTKRGPGSQRTGIESACSVIEIKNSTNKNGDIDYDADDGWGGAI